MNDAKNALSDYLRSLYGIPVLEKDEEVELAKKIRAGDIHARDKLVKHNLRFVVSVVQKEPSWINSGVPMEDLIQFGNMGLIEAANTWVQTNNAKFATYAKTFIKRYVMRGVENTGNIIRLPVNISEEIRRVKYKEARLAQELGREPTTGEIAEYMNQPLSRINYIHGVLMREPSSLDALAGNNVTEDDDE